MDGQQLKPIAVLGAGSWGTALALTLARRGQHVRLWSIETSEIEAMLKDRANNRYLPGIPFPPTIFPTTDVYSAIDHVDDILMVVPSVGFRSTLETIQSATTARTRIICASKGLEEGSGQLFHYVVADVLGKDTPFAVLSGPSFAREVAEGLPTAVTIASKNSNFLRELAQRFDGPVFKVHPSQDVTGTELGGIVKNVIALATGICDGLQLGSNFRSAIITLGLAEIKRLGAALGAESETFNGLAGMGDLILTCTDNQSRNRRYGLAIGKGHDIASAEREIGQVVEGKRNAELVAKLADQHNITMPITETVWQILQGQVKAEPAFKKLLSAMR